MLSKNKKGFTLIELLAVIIILGILLLTAVPAISKYIDNSRKNTYVMNVKSMVDVVINSINNLEYEAMPLKDEAIIVPFSLIELEKGSNKKSPYGKYIEDQSYIMVINNGLNFDYYIVAIDESGYAIPCVNVKDLDKSNITVDTENIEKNIYGMAQISNLVTEQYLITDEFMLSFKDVYPDSILKIGIHKSYTGTLSNAIEKGVIKSYVNDVDGKKYIELLSDIKLTDRIEISTDSKENVVLILNGHTLTSEQDIVIRIWDGNLEIDGTIEGSQIISTSENGSAFVVLQNRGNCIINGGTYISDIDIRSMSSETIYTMGNLTITDAKIVSKNLSGSAVAIRTFQQSEAKIINCDIVADAKNGKAYGLINAGTMEVSNSSIKALANYTTDYKNISQGIQNNRKLTINDSYVLGTHSGIQSEGPLEINGGTYESYGHGGIYFTSSNKTSYVRNAKIQWTKMPDGYKGDPGNNNGSGFYIGGSAGRDNIIIYMDNCDIYGPSSPFVLRGSSGEKNNTLYISNSRINTNGSGFRIDNNTHSLYLGVNNNFDENNILSSQIAQMSVIFHTEEVYIKN